MLAGDGVLEIADGVLGFNFDQLALHELEIGPDARNLRFVLGGDVGAAEQHQVVDVVAGIEKKAAHRRVSHDVIDQGDGSQVQPDKLPDILSVINGQFQAVEDAGDHLRADDFVAVEAPSHCGVVSLRRRLAYVVQQGGPPQPETVGLLRNIVEHCQSVGEVVLVAAAVHGLDTLERKELRQDERQQAGFVHEPEGHGRTAAQHHLVKLFRYPLLGKDLKPGGHPPHRIHRFRHYSERAFRCAQLGGEPHGAQHSERIVTVCGVRIQRSADDTGSEIPYAAERIDQIAEGVGLKRKSHRIDREVTSLLVVLESAVLHYGLAGLAAVGLLAGADELDLHVTPLHLSGTEILEYGQRTSLPSLMESLGHLNAAAHNDNIYIIGGTLQKNITHKTAYHVAFDTLFISHFGDKLKNLMVQKFFHDNKISKTPRKY